MTQNSILIIDDEKSIRELFEMVFSKAGYRVRSVESGEDALEFLKEEKIQVMLMDLNLPGMDGIELCRKIKKDMPMTVIFAITGHATLFDISTCREAGFDDYFKKPVKLAVLLEATRMAFEKITRRRNE